MSWKHAKRFFEACVTKDNARIAEYINDTLDIGDGLERAYSGKTHMDGGIDKMYVKIHDPDFPLRLLPPYASTDDESFQTLIDHLKEYHPDWLE